MQCYFPAQIAKLKGKGSLSYVNYEPGLAMIEFQETLDVTMKCLIVLASFQLVRKYFSAEKYCNIKQT